MKRIRVLVVEDNPGDVELLLDVLGDTRAPTEVEVVGDGAAALERLRGEGAFEAATPPDVVLLDLNLPKKSGHEVLEAVKSDPALRRIPILVLSSSSAARDVTRAYDLGANCYLTKPSGVEELDRLTRAMDDFWLGLVRLPAELNLA